MARTQINPTLITTTGSAAIVPSGTVLDFAGPTAPSGWTECDGSAVSRTTFASLFAAIGTTWGSGNGTTTFNVPDLRRRTCVGRGGSSSGTLGNTLGSVGGEEDHVLSVGELAAHNHGVSDPGHNHTQNAHTHTVTDPGHAHSQASHAHSTAMSTGGTGDGNVSFSGRNGSNTSLGTNAMSPTINSNTTGISNANATATNNSNTTGITTNNNGSGTGHNTIQPSAVMIKIIKN